MADLAGGMYDRAKAAELLDISLSAVDEQHRSRKILGVPYTDDVYFPAAQFKNRSAVPGLEEILVAFGDMGPWGQFQLLLVPITDFTDHPASILELLARGVDEARFGSIVSLVRGWAA